MSNFWGQTLQRGLVQLLLCWWSFSLNGAALSRSLHAGLKEPRKVGTQHLWPASSSSSASSITNAAGTTFWWSSSSYTFQDAAAACNLYGGHLVVLPDQDVVNSVGLANQATYWIGLFNAAGRPGQNGSWVWINQAPYSGSNSQQSWAANEPVPLKWCVYAKQVDGTMQWFADDCSAKHGALCQLSKEPMDDASHYHCLERYNVATGIEYRSIPVSGAMSCQKEQCARHCSDDIQCHAFALSNQHGCHLQRRSQAISPAGGAGYRSDILLSCLKYGLDFVAFGKAVAANTASDLNSPLKCVTGYQINMEVESTVQTCSPSDCLGQCSKHNCTSVVHSRSRCQCKLASKPLDGSHIAGAIAAKDGEFTSCVLYDHDWLQLGKAFDPVPVTIHFDQSTVYSFHREPLSFDAAVSACSANGATLASVTSVRQFQFLAEKFAHFKATRQLSTPAGMVPDSYGLWLGLRSEGQAQEDVDKKGISSLVWLDGQQVNSTLLSQLAVKQLSGSSITCLMLSMEAGKPSVDAAGACSWELPFVCAARRETPPAVKRPVKRSLAEADMFPISGLPDFFQFDIMELSHPNLIWVPPSSEPELDWEKASEVCQAWDGALLTIDTPDVHRAVLASGLMVPERPAWINLKVGLKDETFEEVWSWAPPANFTKGLEMLDNYRNWCDGVEPDPTNLEIQCAILSSESGCTDYGWVPTACEDQYSYVCQMNATATTSPDFFCAERYELGGTIVSTNTVPNKTMVEVATYCADFCRDDVTCHAFVVQGTKCQRMARPNAREAGDRPVDTESLACLKYGLQWDVLGGVVAVEAGVAADASTRFRCIMDQEVKFDIIRSTSIESCLASNCTAQCFAFRFCSVAMYDHNTCTCHLGRIPSSLFGGSSVGRGLVCINNNATAFQNLGITVSKNWILPPDGFTPETDSNSGQWTGPGEVDPNVTTIPNKSPNPPSPPQSPPLVPETDTNSGEWTRPPLIPSPSTNTTNTTGPSSNTTPTTPLPPPASPMTDSPDPTDASIGTSPSGSNSSSNIGFLFSPPTQADDSTLPMSTMIAILASVGGCFVLLGAAGFVYLWRRRSQAVKMTAKNMTPELAAALTKYMTKQKGLPEGQQKGLFRQAMEHFKKGSQGNAVSSTGGSSTDQGQYSESGIGSYTSKGSGSNPASAGGAPMPGEVGTVRAHNNDLRQAVAAAEAAGTPNRMLITSCSGNISNYIMLVKMLGQGSFGTVYQGTWQRQTVAVKIIPHSHSAAVRVKNEVELSMHFNHPNVVRSFFYETFDSMRVGDLSQLQEASSARDTQETWIVLEFCEGGSLASRLYRSSQEGPAKPLHLRDPLISTMRGILNTARGVAEGVAYLHSISICHGDLKCENILLAKRAEMEHLDGDSVVAKVGDFGLSRAMGEGGSHLSTATVGTVTHMPPELLLSGQLRPSCDVYSFGIMLWQLYTGQVPYQGMRYAEIVYKVAVGNMRPQFPAGTPVQYQRLAEQCWHSDANVRPSFEQILQELHVMLSVVDQLEVESAAVLSSSHAQLQDPCGAMPAVQGQLQDQGACGQPVQGYLERAPAYPGYSQGIPGYDGCNQMQGYQETQHGYNGGVTHGYTGEVQGYNDMGHGYNQGLMAPGYAAPVGMGDSVGYWPPAPAQDTQWQMHPADGTAQMQVPGDQGQQQEFVPLQEQQRDPQQEQEHAPQQMQWQQEINGQMQ